MHDQNTCVSSTQTKKYHPSKVFLGCVRDAGCHRHLRWAKCPKKETKSSTSRGTWTCRLYDIRRGPLRTDRLYQTIPRWNADFVELRLPSILGSASSSCTSCGPRSYLGRSRAPHPREGKSAPFLPTCLRLWKIVDGQPTVGACLFFVISKTLTNDLPVEQLPFAKLQDFNTRLQMFDVAVRILDSSQKLAHWTSDSFQKAVGS